MAARAPAVTSGATGSVRDWSEAVAALRPGCRLDDRAVELRVPARLPEPVGGDLDRPMCVAAVGRSRKEAAVIVAAPGGALAMTAKPCALRFGKCLATQPGVSPRQRHAYKERGAGGKGKTTVAGTVAN